MVAFKYVYASLSKYTNSFDKVFCVAGRGAKPEEYHRWLIKEKDKYTIAAQFDVFYKMAETMDYYKQEREMGIDWTLPVLQENFANHLGQLKPELNDYICLGEVQGKQELEDNMKRLPGGMRWHGLAKGNYIGKQNIFHSIDSSAWITGAIGKKTDVFFANSTHKVFFGDKGKQTVGQTQYYLEMYKDNLEKIHVTPKQILDGEYTALLKAPIALLYMPICKSLGVYDQNFISD